MANDRGSPSRRSKPPESTAFAGGLLHLASARFAMTLKGVAFIQKGQRPARNARVTGCRRSRLHPSRSGDWRPAFSIMGHAIADRAAGYHRLCREAEEIGDHL